MIDFSPRRLHSCSVVSRLTRINGFPVWGKKFPPRFISIIFINITLWVKSPPAPWWYGCWWFRNVSAPALSAVELEDGIISMPVVDSEWFTFPVLIKFFLNIFAPQVKQSLLPNFPWGCFPRGQLSHWGENNFIIAQLKIQNKIFIIHQLIIHHKIHPAFHHQVDILLGSNGQEGLLGAQIFGALPGLLPAITIHD